MDIFNGAGDPGRASALILEALHKHSSPKGIGALDTAGGPSAAEALKKAGKLTRIVAMDTDPPTLQLVRDASIWVIPKCRANPP